MRYRDGPNIFGSTLSTLGNAATIQFWTIFRKRQNAILLYEILALPARIANGTVVQYLPE
jgi:hypothetical protein